MKKHALVFLYLLTMLFLGFSCKKEVDEYDGGNPSPPSSELWGNTINISIMGTVLDKSGFPVVGAQVKSGGSTTTTDGMGVFFLSNVSVYQKLGYVTVDKAGFFPGSRSFVPGSGTERVEIRLLPKIVAGTVNGSTGGTAYLPGLSVTIEPESVVKRDKSVYTGNLKVCIAKIEPNSADFNTIMPGNLIAVQNDQPRGLTSYGMVAVELVSLSGQPLQLAKGQTATVSFIISDDLLPTAPATIDLWSFDESNGYWKHEGQAARNGSEYIAQVSHFSFWNCDMPWDYILLDGLVKNTDGQPVPNATVTITGSNVGSACDITNSQGAFGGYVPANTPISIRVSIDCGGTTTTVYMASYGPYTSNTTLSPIVINPQGITTVTGTVVDCNNTPIVNSYVVTNGQVYYAQTGHFSFQTCGSSISITPYGISPWVTGSSQSVSLTGGTVNAGALQACITSGGGGSCSGGQSNVTDIDGNVYNVVTIGNQCWMQQNLKVSRYLNGDSIPTNLSNNQWDNTNTGACAVYGNDTANVLYGELYNWYAVADPRGLCPTGWHVATESDWNLLIKTLDPLADTTWLPHAGTQSEIAGGFMKSTGTLQSGTGLWDPINYGATNSSGFSAEPGGFRTYKGLFRLLGLMGNWWSSTPFSSSHARCRIIYYNSTNVIQSHFNKTVGYSVRCVRD